MAKETEKAALDEARGILRAAIPEAARALVACLNAENETTRLKAASAILNRAGLTEADRINSTYAHTWIGGEKSSFDMPDYEL